MIETDSLLEKCPRCGAWPMAAKFPKASSLIPVIRLRCSHCGYQEQGRLRRAENPGRDFTEQPLHAGR
jgi:ribosomal protein S27AE